MTKTDYKLSKRIERIHYDNSSSGSFGAYYQISKTKGIKIIDYLLYDYINDNVKKHSKKETLLKSKAYKKAVEEMNLLQLLKKRKCQFTPKCYGLKILYLRGHFYVGILLQHLGNSKLSRKPYKTSTFEKIIKTLRDTLMDKFGVDHDDLHEGNVMRFRKKYWCIDFTPNFIKIL